jgi:3-hydroxybutyryl-CoA dehydrogenase
MRQTAAVEMQTVAVVGLGTMGAGIAEVFARAGTQVVAVEVNESLLAKGRARVEASLQRAVDRGRLDPDTRAAIVDRIRFTTARKDLAVADLVVEAVPERLELKTSLFRELDGICPPHTVLATNTSSLSVTAIAAATGRPDRVIGMHLFNPAPVMGLVEVVRTVLAADDAVDAVVELAGRCGKTPVLVGDRAGFIANALLFGYLNDAALMAERQHAAVVDIDAAMSAAAGLPMGPLTLMDMIGLDVCLEVLEVMYDETRDRRYAPAPLLKRLVLAGLLGRKSGRGYYRYGDGSPQPALSFTVSPPVRAGLRERPSYVVETLLYPHLDDAVRMLEDNYATRQDIDTAMRLGCGYPRGPFELLDEIGPKVVADALEQAGRTPSPLMREL